MLRAISELTADFGGISAAQCRNANICGSEKSSPSDTEDRKTSKVGV